MSNGKNLKPWVKGQSGNPSGKKPVILPEVQRAIEANKNAFKVLLMQKLDEKILNDWIDGIILTGTHEGDASKLKILLEMAVGKMVEDTPDFPLTDEEKLLVMEFRRRKNARTQTGNSGAAE